MREIFVIKVLLCETVVGGLRVSPCIVFVSSIADVDGDAGIAVASASATIIPFLLLYSNVIPADNVAMYFIWFVVRCMCSGVHTQHLAAIWIVGKLQFSEMKCTWQCCVSVCLPVYVQKKQQPTTIGTTHICASTIRFENVIRTNFLFPIKFDKLAFYGQNTWFSLLELPKKKNKEK